MSAEIESLFEGAVVVLESAIDAAALTELTEGEAELIASAVETRKIEFATTRRLARDALVRLGAPRAEILRDENGAPQWPLGFSGSLTHSRTQAYVALGRTSEVGTIGIDVEDREGLSGALWSIVLTDAEHARVAAYSPSNRARAALAIFSAKESFYKAQYPRTQQVLGFGDADVHIVPSNGELAERGTFEVAFTRNVAHIRKDTRVRGQFLLHGREQRLVTTAQIRP